MKTIEQLLELSKNPYYVFTKEERKELDAFLSQNSGQAKSQKTSSNSSEQNTPATVHTKNVVHTDNGVLPTEEQVAEAQNLENVRPSITSVVS
jgi:hypothetical protein